MLYDKIFFSSKCGKWNEKCSIWLKWHEKLAFKRVQYINKIPVTVLSEARPEWGTAAASGHRAGNHRQRRGDDDDDDDDEWVTIDEKTHG